jgi:EAL domain-containing protein (putative c-di-GMP-specific phosphodiesterase class I)
MRSLTAANKIIIKAVVQMAQELGIQTLCEGVETEEQYMFAKEAKIDYIQGFYFFKPASLAVLEHERASHPEADIFAKIMDHND